MKDSGCDHHSLPYMCSGCDIAFLNCCLDDYQAVSLCKLRREGALNPDTFMQHVITFDRKQLTPLDVHPVQVLRIMLNDGCYYFGERWGIPVGKQYSDFITQHSIFICHQYRNSRVLHAVVKSVLVMSVTVDEGK
jgi:hypothetical protein